MLEIKKLNNYEENELDLVLLNSQDDPKFFYKNIDIVISTSKTETFGLTCIEALAMGRRLYTINSKSIESLFGKVTFNIKWGEVKNIARLLIDSFEKKYLCPNISKFKESIMIEEYSKL